MSQSGIDEPRNAARELQVSRRQLLRLGGGAIGAVTLGGFLSACGDGGGSGAAGDGATETETASNGNGQTEAAQQLQGSMLTVRSTDVSWLWAPFLVAEHQGFFADEGLDQEGQPTGQGEVAGMVVSGDAQAIVGSPIGPMKTTVAGQPLTSFAAMVTTYASNIVITGDAYEAAGLSENSSIEERARALEGLRMATTGAGAGPDLLLRYVASELGGLDPNSDLVLTPVQGGGGPMLAAVENGQVDGFCLSSPTSDTGVQQFGMRYLFNMAENPIPELEGYLYIVASATPQYIQENPDHIRAYCRALQRSLNFIRDEPEEFKNVMLELFGDDVDPEVFEAGFEGNKNIYGDSIVITEPQFEQNKEFLMREFEVNNEPTDAVEALEFGDVMNNEIAQQAYDEVNA